MEAWEKEQMRLAIQLPQTENEEHLARMQESYDRVDSRLSRLGLRRVPVDALGNCRFDSIIYSADVPMSAMELRTLVVQYLRPLARFFVDRMEGSSKDGMQRTAQTLPKMEHGETSSPC